MEESEVASDGCSPDGIIELNGNRASRVLLEMEVLTLTVADHPGIDPEGKDRKY